jgi:glycosyltransferase involved in cell wall biosynthesis
VLASRMGGLPELIGDVRCVPANDPAALAQSLRRLWEDPAGRRAEGEALLARARGTHAEERFTRDHLGLYERITNRP